MSLAPRLICQLIARDPCGLPGLALAENRCVLSDEAGFSSYVNRLADAIGEQVQSQLEEEQERNSRLGF